MFSFTRAVPKSQLRFTVRNALRTYVSIGDKVPATPVFEGSPGNDINLAEETASGKTISLIPLVLLQRSSTCCLMPEKHLVTRDLKDTL